MRTDESLKTDVVGQTFAIPPIRVEQIRKEPDEIATSDAPIVLFCICLVMALVATVLLVVSGTKQKAFPIQRFSQIPCRSCQFFKDSAYLKCAVHPSTALTRRAIDCLDYRPLDRRC